LAEVFNTEMYLKHENVFQIHKIHANCISITKYKLLSLIKQNTEYMKYISITVRISITCISLTIQHWRNLAKLLQCLRKSLALPLGTAHQSSLIQDCKTLKVTCFVIQQIVKIIPQPGVFCILLTDCAKFSVVKYTFSPASLLTCWWVMSLLLRYSMQGWTFHGNRFGIRISCA